jgi:hypothetical protein
MHLERELRELGAHVEWPPAPVLRFEPAAPPRRVRRALFVLAVVLAAIGAALAVPRSRAAILHFLHVGGERIELVDRLPAAQERPLSSDLGPAVPPATARRLLQGAMLVPPLTPLPPVHANGSVVSILFESDRRPVLLSELPDRGGGLLQKLVMSGPGIRPVRVGRDRGYWITGPHSIVLPGAAPRLAGNALVWQHGSLTLRIEGAHLGLAHALRLARTLRR